MNDVEKSTNNQIHQIRAKLKCSSNTIQLTIVKFSIDNNIIGDNFPMILMQKKV